MAATEPACVLVVDDDPDIRDSVQMLLEIEGRPSAAVRDGAQALAWLRREDRPCLILLDLMMPGMDGWEFLVEKNRDPTLATIPVVVFSGAGAAAMNRARLGTVEILKKPVDLDVLLSTAERFCVTQHRA